MVRWWVLVHYGPDGAQSIFHVGIRDWLKPNESNHTRFHPLQSFPICLLIHPSIHPPIPHALYARLLWVRFERNGFDLPAAITTERPRFQQDGEKDDKDGPLHASRYLGSSYPYLSKK
jgi:hypothetical protein